VAVKPVVAAADVFEVACSMHLLRMNKNDTVRVRVDYAYAIEHMKPSLGILSKVALNHKSFTVLFQDHPG